MAGRTHVWFKGHKWQDEGRLNSHLIQRPWRTRSGTAELECFLLTMTIIKCTVMLTHFLLSLTIKKFKRSTSLGEFSPHYKPLQSSLSNPRLLTFGEHLGWNKNQKILTVIAWMRNWNSWIRRKSYNRLPTHVLKRTFSPGKECILWIWPQDFGF